ncbi:hypothetical protein QUB70_23725 [Microcoleus sp. A003_D6]
MPIPQEKKFCGMGILPVLVIFARGLLQVKHGRAYQVWLTNYN